MIKNLLLVLLAFLLCFCSFTACTVHDIDEQESVASKEEISEESKKEEVIMPEYWGFNGYNRSEIVGAPEEIASYPTKVKKVSASKYAMSCETETGVLTITLEERPWGMFNLWSWKLTEKNGKERVFVPGSTDFEYVHIPITPKGSNVWSGGNHGNEAFLSLELYDAESGKKLELEVGDEATVNSLHVIEKSKLLWFPDDNGDSIGDYNNKNMTYTDDDVYAEMVRKYTFTGPQIKLNVDYKYVKDVKHYRSYTCMFPISKRFGLWCEMYDNSGKLVREIETLKVGAADYSGKHYSKNVATRAVLYGYEDPRYQFDVRVTTFEDSLASGQGDYLTSYWDMNTNTNKLYFTKWTNESIRLIKAGTEVHTESYWLYKYVPDATVPEGKEEETTKVEEIKPVGTLVSSGLEYTVSGGLAQGFGNYTANLTDGKAATVLSYDNNWFSFYNANLPAEQLNVENGVGYIILDLKKETDLSFVRAHLCNGGTAGILTPKGASVAVSSDGKSFTEVCKLPIDTADESAIYWSGVELKDVKARYVKFSFEPNGNFVFLNEIEVYKK